MTLDDYRRFYAEEIEQAANLTSPALIEAFARVPREKFLGPPPWQIASAEVRALAAAGLIQLSYRTTSEPRHLYHNVPRCSAAARWNPAVTTRWRSAILPPLINPPRKTCAPPASGSPTTPASSAMFCWTGSARKS